MGAEETVAQQRLQGCELLAPPAPSLLEQGVWHGRTGSTTSTKEQLRKEEKKTYQQFKNTQPLYTSFGVEDEEQTTAVG